MGIIGPRQGGFDAFDSKSFGAKCPDDEKGQSQICCATIVDVTITDVDNCEDDDGYECVPVQVNKSIL